MKWIILGALLGLLLLYPALLTVVVTIAAAILSKPVMIAFGLGLFARGWIPRLPRWGR